MKHNAKTFMVEEHKAYLKSTQKSLHDCYAKFSKNKWGAFLKVVNIFDKYNGEDLRIISSNSYVFVCGFYGYIDGERAFFRISKDHNYYMIIN